MSKFEQPGLDNKLGLADKLKKTAVYGAIALGSAACAPGAGEAPSSASAHEARVEQLQDNSPESVIKKLLAGKNIGLNDLGGGNFSLVAIGKALDQDMAEEMAKSELQQMRSNNAGFVFLPVSGAPKIESAGDGFYYVLVEQKGVKE
ncbi:MAG TPA: hypothetical protein PLF71_01835 [bacterium]|nr:MAG: hypothetical protein BWY14_01110 [Parcubacteria group bacterium ADurb.Bin192]HPN14837.1 hypothetical protein [bacterium]